MDWRFQSFSRNKRDKTIGIEIGKMKIQDFLKEGVNQGSTIIILIGVEPGVS